MEKHPEIKFLEPQSMNFDKKLTEIFMKFKEGQDKRGKDKKQNNTMI